MELMTSQSQFLGDRMAEAFSIIHEKIVGKIMLISVSGVLGKL